MDFGFLNLGAQPVEVDLSVTLAILNEHPRLVVQLCSIGLSRPHSFNVIFITDLATGIATMKETAFFQVKLYTSLELMFYQY